MDQDSSCSGSHLSVEEIAVYVDLLTTRPGRLRVETHLVHCDVCLADVVAAVRVLRTSSQGPPRLPQREVRRACETRHTR